MMRKPSVVIAVAVISLTILFSAGRKMIDTIHYADLHHKIEITGSLGEPLGRICTLEAMVVPEDEKRSKAESGVPLLKVSRVNGKKLIKPVIIRYEQFAWNSAGELAEDKIYKITGYETGGMSGIPEEAFRYMLPVATQGFHFDVFLQIVKVEE